MVVYLKIATLNCNRLRDRSKRCLVFDFCEKVVPMLTCCKKRTAHRMLNFFGQMNGVRFPFGIQGQTMQEDAIALFVPEFQIQFNI